MKTGGFFSFAQSVLS